MDKKSLIYISLIVIILVSLGIIAVSFAFIGRSTVNGNVAVEGTVLYTTEGYTLSYSGRSSLGLTLSLDNLSMSNTGKSFDSSTSINVNLLVDKDKISDGVSCSFDVYYEPIVVYRASEGSRNAGLTELAVDVNGNTLNLDNLNAKTKIYSGTVNADSSSDGIVPLNCIMHFYNLNVDQASVIGQKPSGNILIESGECGIRS